LLLPVINTSNYLALYSIVLYCIVVALYKCVATCFINYTVILRQPKHVKVQITFAYKIQTPGEYPEGSIQHSEQGENFK